MTLGGMSNSSLALGPASSPAGDYTVAIGWRALVGNTAAHNVGVGAQALKDNTGKTCAGLGKNSLLNNKGSSCVGVGADSLWDNVGGACTAVGTQALGSNGAHGCTGIGFQALYRNAESGHYTTAIGYMAGANNSKQACLLLGYQASATDHHQMVIGSDNWRGTIRSVYIGKGVWAATPEDVTIQATSSTGTAKGADLILAGGASTGGTPGRVIAARELSTPVLEITGGSDLAESYPVRKDSPKRKTELVELLLKYGAKE